MLKCPLPGLPGTKTVIDGLSLVEKDKAFEATVLQVVGAMQGSGKHAQLSDGIPRTADGRPIARPGGGCPPLNVRDFGPGLCLADAVGPIQFDLEEDYLDLGIRCDKVFQLRRSWDGFIPVRDVSACRLHEATRDALRKCSNETWDLFSASGWTCCIYTDGSAGNGCAGWAATIVWRHYDESRTFFGGGFRAALH